MQRHPAPLAEVCFLARGAVHPRQPPARDDLRLSNGVEVDHAQNVIGEAVEVRRDIGIAAARPPEAIDAEARNLEERDLAHFARLRDVVDGKPRAELLALRDAVGEVVLEVAALAVVGLHRHDVGAVAEQHDVVGDLQAVRARQVAEGEVMHRLQVSRIGGIEDRQAVREHVPDIDVALVHHHLHRIRPAALVAIGDVADALADALRRDLGFGLRPGAERHAGKRSEAEQAPQMFTTRRHVPSSSSERPLCHQRRVGG